MKVYIVFKHTRYDECGEDTTEVLKVCANEEDAKNLVRKQAEIIRDEDCVFLEDQYSPEKHCWGRDEYKYSEDGRYLPVFYILQNTDQAFGVSTYSIDDFESHAVYYEAHEVV